MPPTYPIHIMEKYFYSFEIRYYNDTTGILYRTATETGIFTSDLVNPVSHTVGKFFPSTSETLEVLLENMKEKHPEALRICLAFNNIK